MESIVIRPAAASDAPGIARVHVAAWRSTYRGLVPDAFLDGLQTEPRERFWRATLSNPDALTRVFVAQAADSAIAGFAAGGPARASRPPYDGELYAIYLLDTQQRRGLGRRLTLAVVRQLLATGHRAMLVWALADNPSRGFYAALGGQQVDSKMVEIGGVEQEELAYGWADLAGLAARLSCGRWRAD
jgi:L-amino acid N-acyltransferase YncA